MGFFQLTSELTEIYKLDQIYYRNPSMSVIFDHEEVWFAF